MYGEWGEEPYARGLEREDVCAFTGSFFQSARRRGTGRNTRGKLEDNADRKEAFKLLRRPFKKGVVLRRSIGLLSKGLGRNNSERRGYGSRPAGIVAPTASSFRDENEQKKGREALLRARREEGSTEERGSTRE